MCQIPIKMLKQHAISNSSLHNVKIYSSKGYNKNSQRWNINAANTVILKLWIFSGIYQFIIRVFASPCKYSHF